MFNAYSEMYHAERWHKDERFFAPMIVHERTGEHIYTGDIVSIAEGYGLAKVVKFFTISDVRKYKPV